MRHTNATLMLGQVVHPKVVQERLGHSQVNIKLNICRHVLPGFGREAVEQIGATLEQAGDDGEVAGRTRASDYSWTKIVRVEARHRRQGLVKGPLICGTVALFLCPPAFSYDTLASGAAARGQCHVLFIALPKEIEGGHDWARTSDLTDVNRETTVSPRVSACREWLSSAENGVVPCRGESPPLFYCRPNCISNCITVQGNPWRRGEVKSKVIDLARRDDT